MMMVNVTSNECAGTGLESVIYWSVIDLQERFKIVIGRLLKKHIGVTYEWVIQSNGKAFCKATMGKKVAATIIKYEDYLGRKAKESESLFKLRECISKN